jgi:hypothetical protein
MNALPRRPRSIHEVSVRTSDGTQPFDAALRELLDTFYSHPGIREEALAICPLPLDDLHDAYLAATAEHLARSHGMTVPEWTEHHGRKLKLTVESPAAFRRRLLFVSKNALSRPRTPQDAALGE